MKEQHDPIAVVLKKFENQWDIQELDENHYDRFIAKRSKKSNTKKYWYPLSIAASILVLVGYFTFFNKNETPKN